MSTTCLRVSRAEYETIFQEMAHLILPPDVQPTASQLFAVLAKVDPGLPDLVKPHLPCMMHLVIVSDDVLSQHGRIVKTPDNDPDE